VQSVVDVKFGLTSHGFVFDIESWMLTSGKLIRSEDRFWLKIRACVSMLSMSCLDLMCTLLQTFPV
jgi:hypothetical protein